MESNVKKMKNSLRSTVYEGRSLVAIENPMVVQSAEMLQDEVRRLRRAVDELSTLNDIARAISASLDGEEIMQIIIRRSLRAVNADQGVITLVEEEHTSMKTLVRTMASAIDAAEYHLHQALLGWMHLNKKPLMIDDLQHDSRFTGVHWDMSIHTVLCVPLIVKSELRGVLTVYNKKDGKSFTPDDQRLLAIIAAQSAQVIENARLIEEEKLFIKMQQEVGLAAKIQKDLLPRTRPDVPGYDICARTIPAHSVGGDYFDFIPKHDGRIAICLGDVSGKGLPASLLMANLQATLRGQTLVSQKPSECLCHSNRLLFESTGPEKFATLFYGLIDNVQHTIHYSNAGHNWPFLIGNDGSVRRLNIGGLLLGMFGEASYEDELVSLQPGDLLVIHSDGISEAMDIHQNQFGEDTLKNLLIKHTDASTEEIIDLVIQAVRKHAGTNLQSDDMTIMVIKRL